jgi:hypothetical protein
VKTPSVDELHVAALWLGCYESTAEDDEDAKACNRVRKWLLKKIDDLTLQEISKETKVPVWKIRARLKKKDDRSLSNL